MKKLNSSMALLFFGLVIFMSCKQADNSNDNTNHSNNQKEQKMEQKTNVYELAINKAKDWDAFSDTRAKFVTVLGKEEATLNEGKWKPFFTFGEMDLQPILIGMTHWSSMEGFGEAGMRLMPQEEARNYFATFDPVVYGVLETVDGEPFNMETIKVEGSVVEFAVRTGKTPDAFGKNHAIFFESLKKYDGFKFHREFKYYEMNEQGMPVAQENTQAVLIVWESPEKFQAAASSIMQSPEAAAFMPLLEVKAYFAASPMK